MARAEVTPRDIEILTANKDAALAEAERIRSKVFKKGRGTLLRKVLVLRREADDLDDQIRTARMRMADFDPIIERHANRDQNW